MKIYAVATDNELDQFIGQDVWVKVQQITGKGTEYEYLNSPCFVQILAKEYNERKDRYYYRFHCVHGMFLEDSDYDFYEERDERELDFVFALPVSMFVLCKPLTIISTDDLQEALRRF